MKKTVCVAMMPMLLAACGQDAVEGEGEAVVVEAEAEAEEVSVAEGKADTAESESAATGVPVESIENTSDTRCEIESFMAETNFSGPCAFEPLGGASFVVTAYGDGGFVDGITSFILEADTSTAAGMSARAEDGELVGLGVAERDGACWAADNYQVCAYAE